MSTTLASQVKTASTVHVGSIREVEDVLAASHHRATVICFRGSRDKGPANANLAKNYTEIVCDDLQCPLDGYTPPDSEIVRQLRQAWSAAKQENSRVVLLCCHAGISRSPAAALGLLYLEAFLSNQGEAASIAVAQLLKTRPICQPSRLLLTLILESALNKVQATATADTLLRMVEAGQQPL
jgi:predicted protein tyrosine phosphatase